MVGFGTFPSSHGQHTSGVQGGRGEDGTPRMFHKCSSGVDGVPDVSTADFGQRSSLERGEVGMIGELGASGAGGDMTETIVGPTKTREMHNHHFDSTIWNDLEFRDDDIVISTYARSGTTWTQQIVAQLLFGPDPNLEVAEMSPWLDLRVPPKEVKLLMVEAQTHRRFLKTPLPGDAPLLSPAGNFLY